MKLLCQATAAVGFVLGLASLSFAGPVKLEIRDGLVTLDAKNATIREIFDEWSRVGQTRVINADRAPSAAMTLQLTDVPEGAALEILLRSIAGFVAAPRRVPQVSGSMYDRIMLMPAARPAVSPTGVASGPNQMMPGFARERPQPQFPLPIDDEDSPVMPALQPPVSAGPMQPGMSVGQPVQGQFGGVMPQVTIQASPNGAATVQILSPSGALKSGAQATPATPVPAATRPGMPTTPPKPPGGPGGEGGPGGF